MSLRSVLTTLILSTLGLLAAAAPARADDPAFRVSPGSYDFGDRVIGQEYAEYDTIYVSPTSEAEVVITGMEIVGPDAEDFDFTLGSEECYGEPLFDYMCDIYPTFVSDGEVGAKTAELRITSNATAGVKTIPLAARVVEAATNGPALDPLEPQNAYAPSQTGGHTTYGMGTADFDGDGRADVASAGQIDPLGEFAAAVAFGQADGTFSTPVALGTGGGLPSNVVVGDFDGEDGPDVLVPANAGNIYLNDGEGGFTTGVAIGTAGGSFAAPGDFDDDGDLDVAIAGFDTIEIYLNDGDANFTKTADDLVIQGGGNQVMGMTQTVADFRGTGGSGDFAVTTWDGDIQAFLSDGDGTFTAAPRVRPRGCGCLSLWGISATDVNRDGRSDLSTGGYDLVAITLLGQADGTLQVSQINPVPLFDGTEAPSKATGHGDLNGDGIPELLMTDYYSDSLEVNVGLESGIGFAYAYQLATTTQFFASSQVATGDVDGDEKRDVILGGEAGMVMPILNVGEPEPAVDPASVDFGTVVDGSASEPRTITLSNEGGNAPLVVSAVATGGDASSDFTIDETDCLDGPILIGESCTVEVTFDPTTPSGESSTTLFFTVNTETQLLGVPLSGEVEAATVGLTAEPESVDFGAVTVGGPPRTTDVRVTNDGNVANRVDAPALVGPEAGDFSLGDGCDDALLGPGDFCMIEVTFAPGGTGERSASIGLTSALTDDPTVIPLQGNGVERTVPGISVEPGSVSFPDTEVGFESAPRTVTVTSSGTAPLDVGTVALAGAGAASFTADGGACANRTLLPGASCAVTLRFKPGATGGHAATLTIASGAGNGPATVQVAGTATAKPSPPSPAPTVAFTKKPKKRYVIKRKKLRQVKVAFKADQAAATFQCRLDRKKFAACTSPKTYKNLNPGKHTIRVRAINGGKTGPARSVSFKVVRKKK